MKKFWFNLDDKFRFLIVGGFNAALSYFVYSILCIIFGSIFYQYALALSWFMTSFTSFAMQRFLVFQGTGVWYKEYIKCFTTWIFSYAINAGILEFTVKQLRLNVYLAQLIANFIAAVFTYIVFKNFAFKRSKLNKKH